MTGGLGVLAAWLSPAVWLAMPALIISRGPDGLWLALTLALAPLLGAVARRPESAIGARPPVVQGALWLVAALVAWANVALAAEVAAWLGAPRWQGIALAAAAGLIVMPWRGAGRLIAPLLALAAVVLGASLGELVREAGAGPLTAWDRVASQPAFRFSSGSPWVSAGRSFGAAGAVRVPIVFPEEHRVTAPLGGVLRGRSAGSTRAGDLEWSLEPGQSVTFRTGDRIEAEAPLPPLAFEAGKRVPGAPPSGMAWAARSAASTWPSLGVCLTLAAGGAALVGTGAPVAITRRGALLIAAGVVAAFLWAQGWAVYGLLASPELFLGGVAAGRLLDLRALAATGGPWSGALGGALLAAGLASVAAFSIAMRGWLGARAASDARVAALWAAALLLAAAASFVWPADPWWLTVLALGAAASGLGPGALWPAADARAAAAGGAVGLLVFAALAVVSVLRGAGLAFTEPARFAALDAARDVVLACPVLAALPAGALALLALRRRTRRRVPAAVRRVRS